ncbi:bifunctional hydroxymethylpyrimidine kinase/phosphomethylpyrimidine kinase [Convivina praedatoris]|uniref:Hydroxymethylpyrimidine/phosphomethylpyrimidine kinase n=2 Tax=Convivina praedatoris TaxID=2880963 RepID=A0ABM9D1G0_9LACO|nr:bifunctional hydroxymethylpyrimidine kinase/phosphomethylpyrimidine kinase [Convivina sp. LMG 32447]CAH1851886.1 Hydroxymethylpyrimidine/phosphomethylpyrimidine kinase [Convivina sp. LMG 32447]CAH1853952.1 Hydroxymethylpyrimidine/phosphomethylpyrimidine kinase [Convivina sp. LMG 32447]
MTKNVPEVLTIAGTDSGGGAGMMADIKTMQMCHVFATGVVTGVTAQNTLGVQAALPLPTAIIDQQFQSVANDFTIQAVKTGALFDQERVACVAENLRKYHFGPLVVDPVMVAKGGAKLLTDAAITTLVQELLPLADVITPNLPEAQVIVNRQLTTEADIWRACTDIQAMGAKNVVIKGGHLTHQVNHDFVLLANGRQLTLTGDWVNTRRTHGTGDTFSSLVVSQLAKGQELVDTLQTAKTFLNTILQDEIIVGHGHGPLNHWGAEHTNVQI